MNLFGKKYNRYRQKRGGAKLRIQRMARGGGERDTKRAEKREEGPQDNKDRQRQWSTAQSEVTREVDGSAPSGACLHLYLSGHGQLPAAGSTTQRADASKQIYALLVVLVIAVCVGVSSVSADYGDDGYYGGYRGYRRSYRRSYYRRRG
ncbi:uncharacterized protein LOC122394621 isoform X1 [Amphibalanus amphitrite]|uniref:uncharacterized protein LOC122394621 isoform X1 n=1 Tax=Amphibalanus amphitrite TaxID=1232801 RepID=UPI001C8FECC3|nr:uncharacterized protein LOC122394621 isoform X1 [Amphibalanus amphitrite]